MTKSKTFVEQLKDAAAVKPEKPVAASKRFTWSAPIVSPQKGKNQDFSNAVKAAPQPKEKGAFAPATLTLADTRRAITQTRKAKKASY